MTDYDAKQTSIGSTYQIEIKKTNILAMFSLISGFLGFFSAGLFSIFAIIFGHVARHQIRAAKGLEEGDGMALVGLIMGYFVLLPVILIVLFGILALGWFATIFH